MESKLSFWGLAGNNGELGINGGGPFSSIIPSAIEILFATSYEWVKAQLGNVIPPNAVKTSVVHTFGSTPEEQYLGRVCGEIVCGVTITDGMIDYFAPKFGTKTTSGEIIPLTEDPSK